VGYDESTKGYRIWLLHKRSMIVSRDVSFDETCFYRSDPSEMAFEVQSLMESRPLSSLTEDLPLPGTAHQHNSGHHAHATNLSNTENSSAINSGSRDKSQCCRGLSLDSLSVTPSCTSSSLVPTSIMLKDRSPRSHTKVPIDPADLWHVDGPTSHLSKSMLFQPIFDPLDWPKSTESNNDMHSHNSDSIVDPEQLHSLLQPSLSASANSLLLATTENLSTRSVRSRRPLLWMHEYFVNTMLLPSKPTYYNDAVSNAS
jgi:hypothetical protein